MPIVEAVIDEHGKVIDSRLMRRTHWRPAWPAFDQAALDAVRKWEFKPAMLNGRPVPSCLTVAINIDWK
jgi:TonB family protein